MKKIHFAKDSSKTFFELHVAPTKKEAAKIVPGFGGALACFDCYEKNRRLCKGKMVFVDKYLDIAVIVHECVHAAMNWVLLYSMPMAKKQISSEDKLNAYYHEACAQLTDMIFTQVMVALTLEGYTNSLRLNNDPRAAFDV